MTTDGRQPFDARPPPRGLRETLRHLGPGLIVTGSIVGSGELIVTTRLGAQVGFTLLWLILLSCLIKVFLQIELGRFALSSGETTLEAFDRMPGPRARVSWLVWCWLAMAISTMFQLAGILYSTADVFPQGGIPRWGWIIVMAGGTAAVLASGRYRRVEWSTTAMVFLFTATSVIAGLALQLTTGYAVRAEDLAEGLRFGIPPADDKGQSGLLTAAAAFGITGVGASELVWYPYWCLEKGYGRFAGPREPSAAWAERARGWVRVMRTDAWVSMAVYTVATVSFYLLGASVLHRDFLAGRGGIPDDRQMLETLSAMYRNTLGSTAGGAIFFVGAFAVLYSTFFVSTASNARLLADLAHVTGWRRYGGAGDRRRAVGFLCIAIPTFCVVVLALVRDRPVTLILVGAIGQFSMLPLIALGTVYLRYRYTDPRIAPRGPGDLFLWIAFATMFALGIYKAWDTVKGIAKS